jgi:hypothetical protein
MLEIGEPARTVRCAKWPIPTLGECWPGRPSSIWNLVRAPTTQNGTERANTNKKSLRGDRFRGAMAFEVSCLADCGNGGICGSCCASYVSRIKRGRALSWCLTPSLTCPPGERAGVRSSTPPPGARKICSETARGNPLDKVSRIAYNAYEDNSTTLGILRTAYPSLTSAQHRGLTTPWNIRKRPWG